MGSNHQLFISVALLSVSILSADLRKARDLETDGQIRAAEQEYKSDGGLAYAEFLERRKQPGAQAAYEKLSSSTDSATRQQALKRLIVLSLLNGNNKDAALHLTNELDQPCVVPDANLHRRVELDSRRLKVDHEADRRRQVE